MRTDEFVVRSNFEHQAGYRFIAHCQTGVPRTWKLQYRNLPIKGWEIKVVELLTDDAKNIGREPKVEYQWFIEDEKGAVVAQGSSPESERKAGQLAFDRLVEIFNGQKEKSMSKHVIIVNDQAQFVRGVNTGFENTYALCTRDGRTVDFAPAVIEYHMDSSRYTYSIQCGDEVIADEIRVDGKEAHVTLDEVIEKCMEARQEAIDKRYPIQGSARVLAVSDNAAFKNLSVEDKPGQDSWPVDPQYNKAGEGALQFVQRGTRVFLCDNIGQRITPYAVTIHLTDPLGFIKQKDFHWEVDLGEGRCWKSPSLGFVEDAGRAAMAARAAIMHMVSRQEEEPKAHAADERELLRLHGLIRRVADMLHAETSVNSPAGRAKALVATEIRSPISDFVVAGEVYRVYLTGARVKVQKVETGGELLLTINTNGNHEAMYFAFPFDAQRFIEEYFDIRGKTEVQLGSNVVIGFSRLARDLA